jgi:hypothetical protein
MYWPEAMVESKGLRPSGSVFSAMVKVVIGWAHKGHTQPQQSSKSKRNIRKV